ncbi:tyrosine-type recombinase/integrase [Dysgonomonas sp. 511]|uniref:tyrosine-type recombinase/integrase n=1 Tax=Dysgonomonas sp. 511 TaxID=2302930 RepID=UPI0013D84608|nr:tyrosine-type recombinase/integrase [Dysgonomonas sp. 511]NDV80088.1 site-specific integrase [Dysgonomonas sp. 511]
MSLKFSNTTSDFLEWDTMLNLIRKLYKDGNYKISLLVACGSFFGLRGGDLLTLTWGQLLQSDTFELIEKKTGKKRIIKINSQLQKHIQDCYDKINPVNISSPCFMSQKNCVYSIQRVNVILKEIKTKYNLKINNFSSHSFRKSFGRAVYNNAGDNSEMALVKLSELFNHSDIKTTRKYLGLRQEELLETYDLLRF